MYDRSSFELASRVRAKLQLSVASSLVDSRGWEGSGVSGTTGEVASPSLREIKLERNNSERNVVQTFSV